MILSLLGGTGRPRGSAESPRRAHQHRRLVKTARLAWLLAVALVGGMHSAHASTSRQNPYGLLDQLARVLVLVENQYVDPVERDRLVRGAIKGMVAELDPHSAYLSAQDFAVFRQDTEGRFGGIGVEVDFSEEAVTVIAPIDGSPAQRAGIRSGDRIVAVDGIPVRNKNPEGLVRHMRGKPGTSVALTIRRSGVQKLLNFTLTREVIEVASVMGKLLAGNVGYLRIKQFQSGTHAELLHHIGQLKRTSSRELAGVVLDVRNNPGGLVDEAVAVADEFLTGGVIFTTRHRDEVVDEVSASINGALRTGPMVVLVNEYSASASELVAGALRDQRRATVVGARTFGKGSVQTIFDLPGKDGLRLTTMRYYTPAGDSIQARGIEPDVRVDAGYVAGKTYGVIRESDLENHLSAEGQQPAGSQARPESPDEEREAAPSAGTHLGVARKIPDNPIGSDDLALSIGYQIVLGVLHRQR